MNPQLRHCEKAWRRSSKCLEGHQTDLQELGHICDRPRSGRKRTINTTRKNQLIKKRLQRNLPVSMRNISNEPCISPESVRRIAKQELQLKPYKLQMVELLTAYNKCVRLERCRGLLHRVAPLNWERILFMVEYLFTIEQAHGHQNDRSWCAEAPGTSAIVEQRQNPKSVIWFGPEFAPPARPL